MLPAELQQLALARRDAHALRRAQRELAVGAAEASSAAREVAARTVDAAWATVVESIAELIHQASHEIGDPTTLAPDDLPSALQVALIGRTEAGKSTLVNGLVRASAANVGDGRQRTTRHRTRYSLTSSIELIDTPGLAAVAGEEDELQAAAGASEADIVVYLLNSDQLGAAEVQAASRVVSPTKPLLLLLNMKRDIDGRKKGRSRAALRRAFLADPSMVFDQVAISEHCDRVAEAAPTLQRQALVGLMAVHALSAAMAAEPDFEEDADALLAASRVTRVVEQLEKVAGVWLPSLRITRLFEPLVLGAVRGASSLHEAEVLLDAAIDEARRDAATKHEQVDHVIARHLTLLSDELQTAVEPLRAAIPDIVAGQGARRATADWETALLDAEIDWLLSDRLGRLADDLQSLLRVEVECDGDVAWETPEFRFDDSIDMTKILTDALMAALGRGGTALGMKAFRKLASRALGRAAAAGMGSAGVGTVVALLIEAARIANSMRTGLKQARTQKQAELRDFLRRAMDELGDELRRQFRLAVDRGGVGHAVRAYQAELRARRHRLEALHMTVRRLTDELDSHQAAGMAQQVVHLGAIVGSDQRPIGEIHRAEVDAISISDSEPLSAGLAGAAHLLRADLVRRPPSEG